MEEQFRFHFLERRLMLHGAVVLGTAGDDLFTVRFNESESQVEVRFNQALSDEPLHSFPLDHFHELTIRAGAGNDTLDVDGSFATLVPDWLIEYFGDDGNDSLLFVGRSFIDHVSGRADRFVFSNPGPPGALAFSDVEDMDVHLNGNKLELVEQLPQLPVFAGLGPGTLQVRVLTGVYEIHEDPCPTDCRYELTGDSVLNVDALDLQGPITLSGNAKMNLIGDLASVRHGILFEDNGLLDIGENYLFAGMSRDLIIQGRGSIGGAASGRWNGTGGITSRLAREAFAEFGHEKYAIGTSGNLSAVVHNGDANMDGRVDDNDVSIVGGFYDPARQGREWTSGDFNYDGVVDDTDVTILAGFYGSAGPAKPEPTALVAPPDKHPAKKPFAPSVFSDNRTPLD